jgi:hypothetical protein
MMTRAATRGLTTADAPSNANLAHFIGVRG